MKINSKKNQNGLAVLLIILLALIISSATTLVFLRNKGSKYNSSQSSLINSNLGTESSSNAPSTSSDSQSLDLSNLPLGDNKYTTSEAKVGYIYSCVKVGGGGGAFKDGPWIDNTNATWSKKDKNVRVDGSLSWPNATFKVNLRNATRELVGNGLPTNHSTGIFPIGRQDDAFNYDRNPNNVISQNVLESIKADPIVSEKPGCLNMGAVGYSLNGVAIFNALDGEGRDAAAHEILDDCGGHPERTGQYHYHDYSNCISDGSTEPKLIGYMLDGFGLYKYPTNPRNSGLDECHGKVAEVIWNGVKRSIYHYVITDEYPYTIGCYRGGSIK